MTRLCSATVEISNGSCWFCCKLAVLSGSAALVVVPATALCAGTLVPAAVVALLTSLATGGAGAAAWFPVDELDDAAEAEAEAAASPDAIIVTPGPAGAAAVPWRRPAVVSVALFTLTVEVEEVETTAWAPGGAGPPATTVIAPGAAAEATVCMVLPDGFALMEPSWKGWAWAADMGNEPAGHMQAQLHPPFAAATAPVAALAPPAPATTVTAAFAAAVVDAAALAVPFPEPCPATTVTAAAA